MDFCPQDTNLYSAFQLRFVGALRLRSVTKFAEYSATEAERSGP